MRAFSKDDCPKQEGFVILPDVSARGVSLHIFLHRSHPDGDQSKDPEEKGGRRVYGCCSGIIVFNLIAPCCF